MSSLRPPPGTVLQGALCGCARQAVLDLQRLETWPGQAIHRLRVRMKKLRALLELLHGHLPPACLRPLKSHARTLRQAFTQDRDEEVLATLEAGLLGRPPAPSPAAVTLSPARRRAKPSICPDLSP